MNQIKKYLPVGSIVKVKSVDLMVMVLGFCVTDVRQKDTLYDYTGCLYPVGVIDSNKTFLFQHDDIEKVIYYGYMSSEYRTFNEKLLNIVKEHHDELLPSMDELEII